MARYNEIQEYIREKHGVPVKTCWIAHVKDICGLDPTKSPNRHSVKERVHPCPPDKIAIIEEAFKHFKMI